MTRASATLSVPPDTATSTVTSRHRSGGQFDASCCSKACGWLMQARATLDAADGKGVENPSYKQGDRSKVSSFPRPDSGHAKSLLNSVLASLQNGLKSVAVSEVCVRMKQRELVLPFSHCACAAAQPGGWRPALVSENTRL